MQIKTVLFDLDGSLLPMDQDAFTKGYFKLLAKKLVPYGFKAETLVDAIWKGTAAMVKNTGSRSNEVAFWETFAGLLGPQATEAKPLLEEFYCNEFNEAIQFCSPSPLAAQTVYRIKDLGFRVALATNPIFPAIATESRIRWCGLQPEDFEVYTTYENTGFCKPNPAYFTDVANRMDTSPCDCLMVGNDVEEDMIAREIGMDVFLLTDCLINKKEKDISVYPSGDFAALLQFLSAK